MGKASPSKGMNTVAAQVPERDYEAEGAHDTLTRAHEIMNNEDLMPRVRKIAGTKAKAATSINDMLAAKKADPAPTINTLADVKMASKAMRKKARENV